MRKSFFIVLYAIALLSTATFAQITVSNAPEAESAPADQKTQEASPEAAADEQARQDSIQAAQAFDDFLSTSYTSDATSDQAAEQSSSSSAKLEESSSSYCKDCGLVIFDAQSSSSERRRYSNDAPIYRFMATVGLRSPSRGIASLEYIVSQDVFNIGVHFTDYDDDYVLFGANAIYYPFEVRHFYTFLSSEWFHGSYEKERRVGDKYEDYEEKVNYWRVVLGIGGEVLFMEHFGAYVEAGFEFFAGNGGYYLHCGRGSGNLDNDSFKLPYGFGLIFPF